MDAPVVVGAGDVGVSDVVGGVGGGEPGVLVVVAAGAEAEEVEEVGTIRTLYFLALSEKAFESPSGASTNI